MDKVNRAQSMKQLLSFLNVGHIAFLSLALVACTTTYNQPASGEIVGGYTGSTLTGGSTGSTIGGTLGGAYIGRQPG